VTTSDADLQRALLKAAFQMPSVQTMMSRKSSITNAFVSAIIPVIVPSIEEIDQALTILGMNPSDVRCAYCGDPATEWDHLRPLVLQRRPTGFISEIANLVPACNKCNQSKGNKPWREWMVNAKAKRSPTGRNLAGVVERVSKLEAYEQWRTPTRVDILAVIGAVEWEKYWGLCDSVIAELQRSQEVANDIRRRVIDAVKPPMERVPGYPTGCSGED
jgi:hypothetical protein